MLEHFIHMHQITGEQTYLNAARKAAEIVIGESTMRNKLRCWYSSWNRHEPQRSDAYIGLYHGSAGCASALLMLKQHLEEDEMLPGYLEDAFN